MDKEKIEQLKVQMQQWLYEVEENVHQIPPTQLYAAIGVVLFTVILFLIIRLFKRTTSNTILLTGLSGSGKTFLFYQRWQHRWNQMKTVLYYIPGGTRAFSSALDEFLPQAAGFVFVVDSVEFLPNSRAAAEYLYEILTKATVVKKKIPVLLLCNKVDKITAHTKEFIRKQLENNKLRTSRTAVSEADISNEFTLGVPGEPFGFSQCYNKVIVAEASGLTGEISQLEQFIWENVKS